MVEADIFNFKKYHKGGKCEFEQEGFILLRLSVDVGKEFPEKSSPWREC